MKALLMLCICILAAPPACSFLHAHKPDQSTDKTATAQAPQLIGRVASIPTDKRFVLIQSYSNGKIEAGTILTTRGADERTANLVTTGESLGQFTAADIQSGLLAVGDAVYSRHVPTPAPLEPTPNQQPTPAEPTPKK